MKILQLEGMTSGSDEDTAAGRDDFWLGRRYCSYEGGLLAGMKILQLGGMTLYRDEDTAAGRDDFWLG